MIHGIAGIPAMTPGWVWRLARSRMILRSLELMRRQLHALVRRRPE
jgi:hypothetical protein